MRRAVAFSVVFSVFSPLIAVAPARAQTTTSYQVTPQAATVIYQLVVSGTIDGSSAGCSWHARDCCLPAPNYPIPGIAVTESSLTFTVAGDVAAQSGSLDGFTITDQGISGWVNCTNLGGAHFEVSNFSAHVPALVWQLDPFSQPNYASGNVVISFTYQVLLNGLPIGSGAFSSDTTTSYSNNYEHESSPGIFAVSGAIPFFTLNTFVQQVAGHDLNLTVGGQAQFGASFSTTALPPGSSCSTVDDCRASLTSVVPVVGDAPTPTSRVVAQRLSALNHKTDLALDRAAASQGKKQQRQYARARKMLGRLLARARAANEQGKLGVPLAPIEAAVNALLAVLPAA